MLQNSCKYAQLILKEAGDIGTVVCRRIYGDWSSQSVSSWKKAIMDYSINAIQRFQNTTGKNASDSALIIDAMDLMHEQKYQSVCIVSSDSDFTRLASRLRESEIYVVGMGEQKTPVSFRRACDKFLYLDVLYEENVVGTGQKGAFNQSAESRGDNLPREIQNGLNKTVVIAAINEIIDTESDDIGWVELAEVGNRLNSKVTDFDVRNFGCTKLLEFIELLGVYEVRKDAIPSNPNAKLIYIRKTDS